MSTKQIRKVLTMMLALLLAAVWVCTAAATGEYDDDDEQDIYWEQSGRAYLSDTLYGGNGRVLSEAERNAFFSTYAVTMTKIPEGPDRTGFFAVNGDGSYSGRYAASWDDGSITASDFYGRFTSVTPLNMYTYALETEQIYWTTEDEPEVMQNTKCSRLPLRRAWTRTVR